MSYQQGQIVKLDAHPRLAVGIVGVADGSVVNYKLVRGGTEGVLIRVALENGGCCTGVEDKASQHCLSKSCDIHDSGDFVVVEKGYVVISKYRSKGYLWDDGKLSIKVD